MAKNFDTQYLFHRASSSNTNAKKRGAYGKIPPKDILLRMDLQEWKCIYCGDSISLYTCELDHIHAIFNGGEHYLYNIVLTCHVCNNTKRARSLKSFCQVMGYDLEELRQRISELNAKQHSLTDFDDEYGRDSK